MELEKKNKIIAFLRNQVGRGEELLESLTKDENDNKLPQRSAYLVLNKYIREFISNSNSPNWIAIPGLRGTGKTTLLAQVYNSIKWKRGYKLYISLDNLRDIGVSLREVLDVYQELLAPFDKVEVPILLFLDEVQYEKNWGITLKVATDKPNKVFVMCTGSSALSLQTNPDVSRRITYVKLFPLCFMEYALLSKGLKPIQGLGGKIRDALFFSETADLAYSKLHTLQPSVNTYWSRIERSEIETYLRYGTLPFALNLPNEALIFARINQTLNNVLTKDVPTLNRFDKHTIDRLSQVLYAVAGSDIVSLNKFSKVIGLNPRTVTDIFDALEKTEVLIRVYPYGAHYGQVKKPSKYLFASSAYRSMYYNLIGSVEHYDSYKGKLLEDIASMYLYRLFHDKPSLSMTYDSAEGGADFIVDTKLGQDGRIAIEIGSGKKECRQAIQTLKKIGGKYGLIVSRNNLALHKVENCISVPLEYFLLI